MGFNNSSTQKMQCEAGGIMFIFFNIVSPVKNSFLVTHNYGISKHVVQLVEEACLLYKRALIKFKHFLDDCKKYNN